MPWIKIRKQTRNYVAGSAAAVRVLIKWLAIASGIGLLVGGVASVFSHALIAVNNFRAAHPWIIWGLPAGGLAIVFLYRFFKNPGKHGTDIIISSIQSTTNIPVSMAPLIFVSTVITHLFGGSAGREGAALQLGGSIANRVGKSMRLNENDQYIIIMCGMSAGFSALFGTPLAATVFALEVTSVGMMHYSALIPCVTASMIAHFTAGFLQVPPEVFTIAAVPAMELTMFFKIVAFAAVLGGVSILFCICLYAAEHLYDHFLKNPYVRIFIAGCLILFLTALLHTDEYLGSGMGIIENIFHHGESVKPYAFLLKMIFTALMLCAGFKGGEIVPSLAIGAAFGSVAATVVGLPIELAAACGMVGVFCGVTNSPIASLLLSFELFGFEGMPYYLITVAVSYMLSGYCGLYHQQKILYSKTEMAFHEVETP